MPRLGSAICKYPIRIWRVHFVKDASRMWVGEYRRLVGGGGVFPDSERRSPRQFRHWKIRDGGFRMHLGRRRFNSETKDWVWG